jgi:hypothetical protein
MCSSARRDASSPCALINEFAGLVPFFGRKNPSGINTLKKLRDWRADGIAYKIDELPV